MSAPLERNRLDEAASPYLQQHADNPVHWQPWDETARTAAAEQNRPIFLSIGYAACHWCHVMEDESFQDQEVATLLNAQFVPIKVDREERPDVDRIYQTICQLVSGQGGWPLSVWLTPDGRPFYVGTYFPKTSGRGRPGFLELLQRLADSWERDREEIEERADEWAAAISDQLSPPSPPDRDDVEIDSELTSLAETLVRIADREHGGFGTSGPKFPQPQRIEALLWATARTKEEAPLTVAREALDAMANRGMYDQLGGGFHRYATDREWAVPHFEKMLYDNASLPRVYLGAYQLTGDPRYAQVAEETFAFVDRELAHPGGGFYSSLDAQSEGTEGAFYVWTAAEVRDALPAEQADLFIDRFGITRSGNFEGGTTVLSQATSIEELAADSGHPPDEVRSLLAEARSSLLDVRSERPRPDRDEKILAGWNGLMISALAEGGLVLDARYADRAAEAVAFVRDHLWDAETGRLYRRFRDGEVGIPAYLDDYAYLGRGAFDTYQATGAFEWLEFAIDLWEALLAACWDPEAGSLYMTPAESDVPIGRPTDTVDQSLPASVGIAADLACSLSPFRPDRDLEGLAQEFLAAHETDRRSSPTQHVTLSLVADRLMAGSVEWTLAADTIPEPWRRAVGGRFIPGRILSRRPPESVESWVQALELGEVPRIWAGREASEGTPTAYVCRDYACSPPLQDPAEALEWLDRLARSPDDPEDSPPDLPGEND